MKEQKIEITLEEYKELLEIKGWYIGWDYAHYGDYVGFMDFMDLEEQIKKALKVLKNEDGTIPDYKIIENALEVLKGVEDE